MPAHEIFISYRRAETGDSADRIQRHLSLEGWSVFLDRRGIDIGEEWQESLEAALKNCRVVVVLIGPQWLTSRLDDPDDPVRREIRLALEFEKPVVPVLIRDAPMPTRDTLPADIQGLSDWQAFALSPLQFTRDMATFIRKLKSVSPLEESPEELQYATMLAGLSGVCDGGRSDILSAIKLHLRGKTTNESFSNKQRAIAQCESWLSSEEPFCLVVADQAQGKSYLCTWWATELCSRENLETIFVPQSTARTARTAANILLARLGWLCGVDAEGVLEDCSQQVTDLRDRILLRLRQCPRAIQIVVLFDGLDDAEARHFSLQMLGLAGDIPRNIRVCAFARRLADKDADHWFKTSGWSSSTPVVRVEPLHPVEVDDYVDSLPAFQQLPEREQLKEQLKVCVSGSPLLLRFWIEHLLLSLAAGQPIDLSQLNNQNSDVRQRVKSFIQLQREGWPEPRLMDGILVALAFADGPVDLVAMCRLLPDDPAPFAIQRGISAMDRLVTGNEREGYAVSHPLLLEEIRGLMRPDDATAFRKRLLAYGQSLVTEGAAGPGVVVPRFIARFLPLHLKKAHARGEWITGLASLTWIDAIEALVERSELETHFDAALSEFCAVLEEAPHRLPELLPGQMAAALSKASIVPVANYAQLGSDVLSDLGKALLGPAMFTHEKAIWALELAMPGLARDHSVIGFGVAVTHNSLSVRSRALSAYVTACDKQIPPLLTPFNHADLLGSAGRCDRLLSSLYDALEETASIQEASLAPKLLATALGNPAAFTHLARSPYSDEGREELEGKVIAAASSEMEGSTNDALLAQVMTESNAIARHRLLRLVVALKSDIRCSALLSIDDDWVRAHAIWTHWPTLSPDEASTLLGSIPIDDSPWLADWHVGIQAALRARDRNYVDAYAELTRIRSAHIRHYVHGAILREYPDHENHGMLCEDSFREMSQDDDLLLAMLDWRWPGAVGESDAPERAVRSDVLFAACTIEERYELVVAAAPGANAEECALLTSLAQTIDDDRMCDMALGQCAVRLAELGHLDRAEILLEAIKEPIALGYTLSALTKGHSFSLQESMTARCISTFERLGSRGEQAIACALISTFTTSAEEWIDRASGLLRNAEDTYPMLDLIPEMPTDERPEHAGTKLTQVIMLKKQGLTEMSLRAQSAHTISLILPCPRHDAFLRLITEFANARQDIYWSSYGLIMQADHLPHQAKVRAIQRASQLLSSNFARYGMGAVGLTCVSRLIELGSEGSEMVGLAANLTGKLFESFRPKEEIERSVVALNRILRAATPRNRVEIWCAFIDAIATKTRQSLHPVILGMTPFLQDVGGRDLRTPVLSKLHAIVARWP